MPMPISSACAPRDGPPGAAETGSMPRHRQRKTLPYSASQMLDLVVDIERYPDFLPWCMGARVRSRECVGGIEIVVADVAVGIKALRETFTSRVRIDRAAGTVDVDYLKGPFRRLRNRWFFEPATGGTVVDFTIDFEFRNRLLGFAMDRVFTEAVTRMVAAFEQRARKLYAVRLS